MNLANKVNVLIASAKASDVYALFSAAVLWAYEREDRPHLRCLHLNCTGDRTQLVSTDGHGMWICDAFPFTVARFASFNISISDVRAILRCISQRRPPAQRRQRRPVPLDEIVEFYECAGERSVKIDRFQITLANFAHDFPSWRSVVSQTDSSAGQTDFQLLSFENLQRAVRSLPGRHGVLHQQIRITNKGRLEATRFDGTVGEHPARLYIMPLAGK